MIATLERNAVEAKTHTHTVEIQKTSEKRLNAEKIQLQVNKIIDRSLEGGRRGNGWSCTIANKDAWMTPRYFKGDYIYNCKLHLSNTSKKKDETIKRDWDNIIKVIGQAGNIPGWSITIIDGKVASDTDERIPRPVGYVPVVIPDNWQEGLSHIFEREDQIDVIMAAIDAGIKSDFQDRFHCALIGDPACGKTETLRSIKNILGDEAVMEYDATATTQAGAIKDLSEREELPRILIVEEIEKTDENSLRWLLGVLDHRAEIRKVNFRSNIQKETRMLTLATVNDYKLFSKIMFGALASRFAYHIHFPRPNRNLLQRILEREIDRVRGNKRWIKPTLDFAVSMNIYDPRKVTAICLCGRDQLLDKSFQKKLQAVSAANFIRDHEKEERRKRKEESAA